MRNKQILFLPFLLFLFTAEDSSRRYNNSRIHTAKKVLADKIKFLFWCSLSIAVSLMIANLH